MEEATQVNYETLLVVIIISLLLSWLVTKIAMKAGYYTMPANGPYQRVPSFSDVVFTFVTFFLLQLIFLPLIAYLWLSYQAGELLSESFKIPENELVWMNSVGMWISALGMWTLCSLFQPSAIQSITETETKKHSPFYNFCFGAMSWLVCYPLVLVISHVLGGIVAYFFNAPETQQSALKLLKDSSNNPLQLFFFMTSIILIVPMLEEFLFRGILQRWIIKKTGFVKGIALTSLVFASLHFAATLKSYNLQLLPPLFLLSCFLGYLYERQRSLWAPIGLHTTFNLVSSLFAIS